MSLALTEKFLAKLLGFTGAFTTLILVSGSVTDPVNTPKMVAIGIFGFSALSIVLLTNLKKTLYSNKLMLFNTILFLLFLATSSFVSNAPFSQVLYGSYGRNNGLLTYVCLSFILLATMSLNSIVSFNSIIKGFMTAGVLNVAYCLWVIFFGDFISWYNPYKSPLGTLGNPNFIGAFLGMFFAALSALIFDLKSSKFTKTLAIVLLPIVVFEILKTNAIQGRVVAIAGLAIVIFFFLKAKFNTIVVGCYTIFITIGGGFALAGALQMGPLAQYIYKTSVSLRGQYWLAGWNTGQTHPFTGVGMDAFGDWYRRMRDARALELPGVNTVVNASHNVPLDLFAFGGWPLFLTYLTTLVITMIAIIKTLKRTKIADLNFVILVSVWFGYQLQSLISINQIGLAIWGWILSGALISYERVSRVYKNDNTNQATTTPKIVRNSKVNLPAQVPLFAVSGGLIGLLLTLPPLSADLTWMAASKQHTISGVEEALKVSYFNPPNSVKYLQAVQTFEQNGLFDLAKKYALQAVAWNPDSFDAWRVLYSIKNTTEEEKNLALKNMKRLDPLNKEI